jgi:hypothetical protein
VPAQIGLILNDHEVSAGADREFLDFRLQQLLLIVAAFWPHRKIGKRPAMAVFISSSVSGFLCGERAPAYRKFSKMAGRDVPSSF